MEKIIEAIIKAIPFAAAFSVWGISEDTSKGLAAIAVAILLYLTTDLLKKWQVHRRNKKTATDLYPYFNYEKVKQATDLYIQSQGQNLPPSYEEEMKDSNSFIVKKQLIPWFLTTAFNEKKDSNKYYLILADSGMGKTTFMINLYVRYHAKYGRKYKIKLIPFGDDRIIGQLKELAKKQDEAKNTILLLDAFDEYKGLLPPETPDNLTDEERFRKQFEEIAKLTQDFREVVITSRTQYFPGQEKEDYILKIKNFSTDSYHKLVKLYLSPFDEKEIKQYLNKKYGIIKFWNKKKKRIAESVVNSSPKLMVRPMLLAYIDYLVDENKVYKTTFEIYDTLVAKWIEREAEKRKVVIKVREKFEHDLFEFSQQIALVTYKKMQENPGASIDKETALQVCNIHNLDLKQYEITGQSLLTRDANFNWKFAHKSILEFFIAKHAINHFDFYLTLANSALFGIDMTEQFCSEASDFVFVKGGTFKQEKRNVTLSNYIVGKYPVTQKLYQEVMDSNRSYSKVGNNPVEQVSWYDAIEFCNKLSEAQGKEPYYIIDKNKKDPNNKNKYDDIKWTVSINKEATGYRLLTEAEWEYAARGGIKSKGYEYAGSNNVDEVAWYDKNSGKRTHSVGEKKANELGIYDMSGNVWEWCYDWYGEYEKGDVENPQGAKNGSGRVDRGGGWSNGAEGCRVGDRGYDDASSRDDYVGFRIALSL